jgi:hypothetical protein
VCRSRSQSLTCHLHPYTSTHTHKLSDGYCNYRCRICVGALGGTLFNYLDSIELTLRTSSSKLAKSSTATSSQRWSGSTIRTVALAGCDWPCPSTGVVDEGKKWGGNIRSFSDFLVLCLPNNGSTVDLCAPIGYRSQPCELQFGSLASSVPT